MESLSRERSTHSERSRSSHSTCPCFNKDGLKPLPDKVRAIEECGVPGNKGAVRNFLGMASYLDNFIKNYAATRKETKFYWGKQEETAFGKITRQHLQ